MNRKYCLSDQGKDALLAMQTVENVAGLGAKKNGKSTAILWVVTGLISGSLSASYADIVKQNARAKIFSLEVLAKLNDKIINQVPIQLLKIAY